MAGGAHDADCRSGGHPEGGRPAATGSSIIFPAFSRFLTSCGCSYIGRRGAPTDRGTAWHLGRLEELEAPDLPVSCVYIVENLQTGLAFEDHPGSEIGRASCRGRVPIS